MRLPMVVASTLKTWANGWCTTQRFHDVRKDCVFSCGMKHGDTLTHYLQCRAVLSFWSRCSPVAPATTAALKDRMLLMAPDGPTLSDALLLHATFSAYELLRATGQAPSVEAAAQTMEGKLKVVRILSKVAVEVVAGNEDAQLPEAFLRKKRRTRRLRAGTTTAATGVGGRRPGAGERPGPDRSARSVGP